MALISCSVCKFEIDSGPAPAPGQFITCPLCGACLEVIWLRPLTLAWIGDDTFVFEDSTIDDEMSKEREIKERWP